MVINAVLNLDLRVLLWAIMIIPYFEPWNVDYLISQGVFPTVLTIVSTSAMIIKAVVSVVAAAWFFLSRHKFNSCGYFTLFAFAISMGFASVVSSNWSITNDLFRAFQFIGFACLLCCLYQSNKNIMMKALMLVFVILGVMAIGTIYFTDGGLIPGLKASARQYSFGGKNSLFVTLCPLVVLVAAGCWNRARRSTLPAVILSLLLTYTSLYIDSSSSSVHFALLAIMLVSINGGFPFSKMSGRGYFAIIVLVFMGTVLGSFIADSFSWLFDLIGRDTSFSQRDQIWSQALTYIAANPLFGSGSQITYIIQYDIGSAATNIAHCFFLDVAAKYGLVTLVLFIADAYFVLARYDQKKSKLSFIFMSGFILILGHSLYDDLIVYIYITMHFLVMKSLEIKREDINE